MHKVVVELRCNEFSMREHNPHVPWSPEEIAHDAAECREAGAAILHYHARDPQTGAPSSELELYADTIRRVRASCDLLINPTLGAYTIADPAERVAHIPELGRDAATRADLAPVDLVTTNIDPYEPGKGFALEDLVYTNTISGIRTEIEAIHSAGTQVDAVLWNVGSARVLGALLELGLLSAPVFTEIALSDTLLATHPATAAGLDAMLAFLPEAPTPWAVLNAGGNLLPLVEAVVQRGGHLALGLGDDAYRSIGQAPSNAQVIAAAVAEIRRCGAEIATPDEAREILGLG